MKNQDSQKGSSSVALLLVFVVVLAIAGATFQRSARVSHSNENVKVKQTEKWQARSAMNVLQQVLRLKLPEIYNNDLSAARALGEGRRLPAFDAEDGRESKPLVVITDEQVVRSEFPVDECTSYFGKVNSWGESRRSTFINEVVNRGYNSETVGIVSLEEVSRQFSGGVEPAYMLGFILDSKSGYYRTRANGEILLGPSDVNCGTTVRLEAIPMQIIRGESVVLRATYTNATKLIFTDSADQVIHEAFVSDQPTPQTYDYTFSPDRTDSYRVEAQSNASCYSRTPLIEVGVSEPPQNVCLTNPPQIPLFEASSTEVNLGETVTLRWQTAGSVSRVLLNGVPVSPNETDYRVIINSPTTFTLRVEDNDTDRDCPIERTITINIRVAPACGFSTPNIENFSANPTSITPGGSSALSWNISGLDGAAGTTRIVGPNGFQQSGLSSNGILNVMPPVAEGDYTYTLFTENVCPDGTRLTAQASGIIQVRICPTPVINSFVANPSTVMQGGSQMITLAWDISGNPSAVSINNGVGGGLPASGTVEIPQPQVTTTYTITAVGCGQTRQYQVTVIVTSCPVPNINSFVANPSTVSAGGSLTVRLSWDVAGTSDTVNISGIGNVTGNYVDIPQPQTTTQYTLTVLGCGTSRTANLTVTVSTTPTTTKSGSRELAQNGGVFSCRSGNEFRVANGFPAIPCTNYTVTSTVTLTPQNDGTYILESRRDSNADYIPELRGSGYFPSVGLFGAVQTTDQCAYWGVPMCYDNRSLLGWWSAYYTTNTGQIVPENYDPYGKTARFRISSIPPGTEKIVYQDFRGGGYVIYFPGYDFGPNDRQSGGDYTYFHVGACCGSAPLNIDFDYLP